MKAHFNVFIQRKHRKAKKTSFLKETVENTDLHKAVLNKTITTQEQRVKYDFVAPLSTQKNLNRFLKNFPLSTNYITLRFVARQSSILTIFATKISVN